MYQCNCNVCFITCNIQKTGVLDLIKKISDWCDEYSPSTKAAREKAEIEGKTPALVEEPVYDTEWAKITLINELFVQPADITIFITKAIMYIVARCGIQILIAGTIMIKIMTFFAPQNPENPVTVVIIACGVIIGLATFLLTEPAVKCLCTNLNVDNFMQESS